MGDRGPKSSMEEKLTLKYDLEGDILYLSKISPYKEQESAEISDGVIARFNPTTNEIENHRSVVFLEEVPSKQCV